MSLLGMKIAVIGGGIAGLAVSRALAMRGASVTVLEQAPEITEVGAGLQISPNGFAVLDALGLGDALAQTAVRANAVSLRDYRKAEVVRLDLTRLQNRNYFFVHRADLIEVLATGAREAGVKIRLLQQVDQVIPGDPPTIRMSNGTELHPDLVIGADGLHSKARVALNGADRPFFTGQVAWRCVIPNILNLPPVARVHMGPGRHVVSYPLRRGELINIVAVQERAQWVDEGWHHEDDPANLRNVFADFGPEVQQMLSLVDKVNLWGLFRHPVARQWHGQNVAILGDAAHPTLPFLAQGACMGLEDAWALAEELSASESTAVGLSAYQRRRQARATKVINAATRNAWKYHLGFGPLRFAAHTALRLGGALAPDQMLHQFDWLYLHDETQHPS
ncbi:monooxygenase [Thalassobius vesicularis]|uniref:Monooxygenase n=1 Tax=Thalassobius vesicularis TaxID=1294297 RepID=A0A4V3UZ49_9RHOB|nr:FAD-dependent oxidoreductase [Thalassobius vesicularis]THD74822.1 monooxygenase [Thalassobius vesicularis]